MKIVFDLLCTQPVRGTIFHGGGEYTKVTFLSFLRNKKSEDVAVCINKSSFIDPLVDKAISDYGIDVIDVKTVNDIIDYLSTIKDVSVRFFAGMIYEYVDISFPNNVTSIGTCHGLRPIEKPSDYYESIYLNSKVERLKWIIKRVLIKYLDRKRIHNAIISYSKAIKNFDILITDSNHSATSLQINLSEAIKGKEIHILYPITQFSESVKVLEPPKMNSFILMISANRWIKNSYRGICALDDLYSKGLLSNMETRIYGNLPINIKKRIVNIDKFKFFDYVSVEDLESAYASCELFLYPTLNEGFGNVPMEVMKYGKTCIVSSVCSLPEVYGESVYYCNPYDIMEIENRVIQALQKKIDIEIINNRLDYLSKRQSIDMNKLCALISGQSF